ncbi:MAG: hypothetical protein ACI9OD_001872 [Limisphaerales bacterium]|jgi:hypothetical protein
MTSAFKPFTTLSLALVGTLLSTAGTFAAESAAPKTGPTTSEPTRRSGPERDDFKVVVTRNIFNPNRGYKTPPPKKREAPRPVPTRTDELTLTGVLTANSGSYGFFDGSSQEFRRVAKLNQKIAEFTVMKITTSGVELQNGTNTFDLALREKLLRTGSEPWKKGIGKSTLKSSGSVMGSSSSTSTSSSSTDSKPSTAGAPSSEDDERRKRLLELMKKRRAK